MDYNKEINSIIERALTEKTFNLEIIEEIKKLRELPEALEVASKQIETLLKEKSELTTKVTSLEVNEASVNERELAVATREQELTILELKAEFNKTRADEIKEMFGIVFKNPVLKENVYKSSQVQVKDNSGYSTSMPESENVQKTVEIE